MAGTQPLGRHRLPPPGRDRPPGRRRRARFVMTLAAGSAAVFIAVTFAVHSVLSPAPPPQQRATSALPATPASYIGLYMRGVPKSYTGVKAFAATTRVKPGLVVYYSGWLEPFQSGFATTAAKEGAVPLVQINPVDISIAAIASGHYDAYLRTYAQAVRAYRYPVVISFGHEMNGYWYSWGYKHTSPAVFVAAWRHIVNVFRAGHTRNVTWLWTVNTIHPDGGVPAPGPWWPGSSFVTWIGIDGYYLTSPSVFATVFGPTIASVRTLTRQPILIAETAATPAAGQPAKIADLFAGTRLYGLLGFVWFDTPGDEDWRLDTPAAITALRQGARTYRRAR